MYCRKCGAQISDSAKFCTKCGTAVVQNKVQNTEATTPVDTQLQESIPQDVQQQVVQQQDVPVMGQPSVQVPTPAMAQDNQPEGGEEPKKKPIVPIAIILVCILGLVVGGLVYMKLKGDDKGTVESDGEITEELAEEDKKADRDKKKKEAEPTPEPKTAEDLLTEGKEYLTSGDFVKALECYEDAKELDAENEDIFLYGADVYLSQDNYSEALKILDTGIEALDSQVLKQRKDYVISNIVIKEQTSDDYYANAVYEYDEFGNTIKDANNEYTYDDNGNLTGRTSYDGDGNFIEKIGFKYDASGRLIQMMNYAQDGTALGWTQYEYAPGGEIINEVYYDESGVISFWFGYAYSDDGIKEKKIYHESDGDVAYWYEYDAAGNQLREIHNSSNGKVNWWNELVYDEDGKVLSEVEYNYRGKVNWRGEYSYDANGNRIRSITYGSNDKITDWREHVYDNEGRKLKSSSLKYDGTPYYWVEYTYDENGNEIKYTEYNENGIATSWRESEYTTDENGNMVVTVYDEKGQVLSSRTTDSLGLICSETTEWGDNAYTYTYIGDIVSTSNVSETTGTLRVADDVALQRRRVPNKQAAYIISDVGGSYDVVGETEEFYLLADGWYVAKDHKGITY
ncbi:MAG: zinc-ribbon domain-containing protein [Lachnospiraceae bacterium]|nr:zinc-ribbon domain-containing protein [Lachnospiraceae bacterium]